MRGRESPKHINKQDGYKESGSYGKAIFGRAIREDSLRGNVQVETLI